MSASNNEITDIVRIVSRYLPLDKAAQLAVDLDKEIGERTDNNSLRISLQMLRAELEENATEFVGRDNAVHSIDGKHGLRTYDDMQRGH